MPPHIDKYALRDGPRLEFLRRIEDEELEQFQARLEERGQTIKEFNFVHDYVIMTPVHDDGECHQQEGFEEAVIIFLGPLPPSTKGLISPPNTS